MGKAGRPTIYSDTLGDTICARISDGESLRSICRDETMPARSTVFVWLSEIDEFRTKYVRAREFQAESYADEIVELSDATHVEFEGADGVKMALPLDHNRARLQIGTRQWVLEKLLPKKYGARVAHVGGGPTDAPIAVAGEVVVRFMRPGEVPGADQS